MGPLTWGPSRVVKGGRSRNSVAGHALPTYYGLDRILVGVIIIWLDELASVITVVVEVVHVHFHALVAVPGWVFALFAAATCVQVLWE